MSTSINITKKINVKEEGVSITSDLNSINFVGNGVTASAVGQDVTVDIPGSSGSTLYYFNYSVSQAPYKEFSSAGTTAIEQVVPATVAGGATTNVISFQTASGVPNTTVIPQGLWQLFLHFNAGSAGQNWIIRPYVYKRDLAGIETLIFTPDPEIVTNMSTTTTMYTCDGVFPVTTLLTTDRIVVKIDLQNTTGVSQTASFRTEGSQHYSVATTTLNQVVSAGAVTNVTGVSPIASSGGTTPAISIADAIADGTTKGAASFTASDFNSTSGNISIDYTNGQAASASNKGFLTSADFTTFNGKVSSVGATSPLTSSGGTTPSISTSMATNKLIGRSTAGTGVMEEITVGSNLTLSGGTLSAAAGGLVYFTEAQNTTAPNATTPVDSLTAVSAATNADFAIIPKGNGAIIADIPDGLVSGGNKRGTGAVDLQLSRLSNADVASGNNSVISGGYRNRAQNTDASIGGGQDNTASGTQSRVGGGLSNTASSDYSTVGGGTSNTASASRTTVAGGSSCGATAYGASTLGGFGNTSTFSYASNLGGQSNTASGEGSSVVGGASNVASGTYSLAGGTSSIANSYGSVVLGVGGNANSVRSRNVFANSSVTGDAQKSTFIFRQRTTDATLTTFAIEGTGASTTNQITLSNNSGYRFKGTIIAKQSGSTNVSAWDIDGLLVRGANAAATTLLIGNVTLVQNTPAWGTPTLAADTSNGGLRIQIQGAGATNIQWVANIETTEVIYA